MRFNYKILPIIKCLEENMLGTIPIDIEDKKQFFDKHFLDYFKNSFKQNCIYFKSEINIISKTFYESSYKAKLKLMEVLFGEHSMLETNINGTFITEHYCHCIKFSQNKQTEQYEVCLYTFTKKGIPLVFYTINNNYEEFKWVSNGCHDEKVDHIQLAIVECLIFGLFKKYADIETNELPAGQKIKGINCEYGHALNETKLNLTYLTSTWFTNLVKSDSFNVRGHFRFQACGKSFKERKLIWINEFQKEGYERKADILK